jgi:hypothetical protein
MLQVVCVGRPMAKQSSEMMAKWRDNSAGSVRNLYSVMKANRDLHDQF